jgi:hypothetical protein
MQAYNCVAGSVLFLMNECPSRKIKIIEHVLNPRSGDVFYAIRVLFSFQYCVALCDEK